MTLIDINGLKHFLHRLNPHIHYAAECETDAATAVKEVTIPHFEMQKGSRITISFPVQNTAKNPKLKVNGGKSYNIVVSINNKLVTLDEVQKSLLYRQCEFLFDGEQWILLFASDEVKKQIVYQENAPTNPFPGMLWLKPIVEEEEQEDETSTEAKLASAEARIADLEAQIAILSSKLAGGE